MPLNLTSVKYASEGTAIAMAALRNARKSVGLLEPIHVVVPTFGLREWLVEQIMRHDAESFGIVMNVKFHSIGDLHRGFQKTVDDQWSIDRQITALLPILDAATKSYPGATTFVSTSGGLLPAADRLAQLFDRYVSRRPRMMHQWETNRDRDASGEELSLADHWQFDVWKILRSHIGVKHSLLSGVSGAALPSHLLVFGIETIDDRTLASLQAISEKTAIEVVAIHPSPLLKSRWDVMYPKNVNAAMPPPPRIVADIPRDLVKQKMMLPYRWLRVAEEMQMTLARAGLGLQDNSNDAGTPHSRLARIKSIVAHGAIPNTSPKTSPQETDDSLVLHRCHGLARQAEVAVDAIVKALNDSALKDSPENQLQLHEIAIMSPNIKRIAPHLRAAFDRELVSSNKTKYKIPLLLADLNLGDIDEGARIFSTFLELVGGRLDFDSVLDVLSDPSFVESRRLGLEAIQRWELHLTRAQQRWGLDAAHRKASFGVEISTNSQPDNQHSWLHSMRRILLGASAQRDGAEVLLNHGVIPDVETDELEDVLELVELIDTISAVVVERHTKKTAADWAILLDAAFSQFCGPFSKLTSVPLRQLQRLASLSGGEGSAETLLSFDEVARFLTSQFDVVSEKSLARSGEVVATGLGVQGHVPYRVVCLVGVDDAAMPSGGRDGFDLAARDNLIGDPDPRHDARRQLLTAVLSASDRVIITCDGRDLKNNDKKNLSAPLDEFVSWCADADEKILELEHPRHLYSPRNFVPGGEGGLQIWSHDDAAREVAEAMQQKQSSKEPIKKPIQLLANGEVKCAIDLASAECGYKLDEEKVCDKCGAVAPKRVEISMLQVRYLRDMLFNPLSVFLRWSYNIVKNWDESPIDNTLLSLELTNKELEALAERLIKPQIDATKSDHATALNIALKAWKADNRRLHLLPVTDAAKDATEEVVEEVVGSAVKEWRQLSAAPLTEFETKRLEIPEAGIVFEGDVPSEKTSTVLMVRFDGRPLDAERETDFLMLQLLFYRACGYAVNKIQVVAMKDKFADYVKERDRQLGLKKPKIYAACTSYEIGWSRAEAPTTEEAIAWLTALVELYRRSAEKPVPTFAPHSEKSQSTTAGYLLYLAKNSAEALKTFDNEVSESATEQKSGFAGTDEALIYGVEPTFADCFPIAKSETDPKPFEQQFWLDRNDWWVRPSWSKRDSSPQFVAEVEVPKVLKSITQLATEGSS